MVHLVRLEVPTDAFPRETTPVDSEDMGNVWKATVLHKHKSKCVFGANHYGQHDEILPKEQYYEAVTLGHDDACVNTP